RGSFIIDVEAAAAVGDRAVIDYRAERTRDLLANAPREGRRAFAIEVTFEAVADRLVQQDSRPSRTQHHDHFPRRRIDGVEVDDRLARRFERELAPALAFDKVFVFDASAAAVRPDLAMLAVVGDHGDVEAAERLQIGRDLTLAVNNHYDLPLCRKRGHHV